MTEGIISDEQIIREFLEKMSTQDNRATAFPFYYVIRTADWRVTEDGYGGDGGDEGSDTKTVYVLEDSHECQLSQEEYDKLPETSDDAKPDDDMGCKEDYKEVFMARIWREEGIFFTETDAKGHLERNSYHYSPGAHTYVKHVWRAPELERFLLALFKTYGIPPRKDPGTM
jgi:hypothetical protein